VNILWQCESSNLAADIHGALAAYLARFGVAATVVYVRPGQVAAAPPGVMIEERTFVTPGTIQVGPCIRLLQLELF
jgi:hypothetical protein